MVILCVRAAGRTQENRQLSVVGQRASPGSALDPKRREDDPKAWRAGACGAAAEREEEEAALPRGRRPALGPARP